MSKFVKQRYYKKDGTAVINCYHINISKALLERAGFNGTEEIEIKAKNGKIIIEKVKNN